ncbi:MAG: carboxypeptidase-like regulatory domain-containing protein [Chloroflexi bacterium]|nr:carboxypeptidase-like regulatory domain-containing protein [Chloroflexota bacterium]
MKAIIKIILLFLTLLIPVFASACNLPAFKKTPIPESSSPLATPTFLVGDLGWGAIHGKVTDSVTGLPIPGAIVTCRHSSYTSPSLCNTSTVTEKDGIYTFPENFFHDTDRVHLEVQAKGYVTQSLDVNFLISPWLNADFTLTPAAATEAPQVMCTQPACGPYESLFCPQGDCPNGCGYVCATPAAICTPPLCAIDGNEVYFCSGVCPGGCGTTCATITPGP